MKSNLIWVCPAERCGEAAQTGQPVLRVGLGLDAGGTLIRTLAQKRDKQDVLCLSDYGISAPISDTVVRQLIEETRGTGGLLADLTRSTPFLAAFLAALDEACSRAAIPLFVPMRQIRHAPHAIAVAPGAASGGCLRDELEQGMLARNGQLAVLFEPIRRRFLLPAQDPNGEALTVAELDALRGKCGAHVFFSRELCANYFTYMEGDTGVFVLFDTEETLRQRLQLIRDVGVPFLFADYESCSILL